MALNLGTLYLDIEARTAKLESGAKQAVLSLNELERKAQKTEQALGSLATKAGAAFAGLAYGMKKIIDQGTKFENAFIGLESFAKNAGIAMEKANQAAKELSSDGLMSAADAATSLKNLLAAGFGLDQAVVLIERFKDSAAFGRQSALSFGDAVRSATEGIKNGNSILVDNAGVTKNLSVMLQEAGYSAQDLMRASQDAGIRQAIFNGILRETRFQVGDAAKLSQTFAGQMSGLSVETQRLAKETKSALEPTLRELVKSFREIVRNVTDWISANPQLAAGVVKTTAETLLLVAATAKLAQAIVHFKTEAMLLDGVFGNLVFAFQAVKIGAASVGEAIGFLAAEFAPFLVAGTIVVGLTAIINHLRGVQEAARDAALSVSKVFDVEQARDELAKWRRRAEQAQENYDRLRENVGPRVPSSSAVFADVNKELALANTKVMQWQARLSELLGEGGKGTVEGVGGVASVAKSARTAADVLADMQNKLAAATTLERLLGDAFDLNAEKANIFRSALEELADPTLKATDSQLKGVADRLKRVSAEIQAAKSGMDEAGEAAARYGLAMGRILTQQYFVQSQDAAARAGLAAGRIATSTEYQLQVEADAAKLEEEVARYNLAVGRVVATQIQKAADDAAARLGLAMGRLATVGVTREQDEAAAAQQEEDLARYGLAMGRVIATTYQADQAWAKFKLTASDAITAVLEGSKSLGEVIESIFKGKAHNSIKKFVDDALDSFRELRKEGQTIFQALAKAIQTNFSALDVFGAMGIGAAAGGAIGGNATGASIGAVIGAIVGAIVPAIGMKLGSILGGLFGGLFGGGGGSSSDEDPYRGKRLNEVAANLRTLQLLHGSWLSGSILDRLRELFDTTQDSMANALANAFDAASYEEFTAKFGQNLEATTKKALITAFMASETIRPLLDNLSNVITKAVADGTLTAEERQSIIDLYKQITDKSGAFYEALQQLGIATDDVAGSMTALGEALRNVPTGFKIATARWDAALPRMAEGGIVTRPTVALVGEAGPEAVVPLSKGGAGMTIVVNVQNAYGFDDFERKVNDVVSRAARRAGLATHGLAYGGAY